MSSSANEPAVDERSFSCFGLDLRVVKAVHNLGLKQATLVQSRCIPIALTGRDMLVRSHTGTGKSLAYALPMLHTLLQAQEQSLAIVLVPTRELCVEAAENMKSLAKYCQKTISVLSFHSGSKPSLRGLVDDKSLIVFGTPSAVLHVLNEQPTLTQKLRVLAVDEADLVLSYGYDDDMDAILEMLPRRQHQTILLSATITPELQKLKTMSLHSAAIVQLVDGEEDANCGKLKQFVVKCEHNDRFLIIYTLLKLGPISGKTIIFVNDVSECFRVKLFLECFSLNAAVLNAELPTNSRARIVEHFNRGVFDLLIATDAALDDDDDEEKEKEQGDNAEKEDESVEQDDADEKDAKKKSKAQHIRKRKAEFGVARGVDFKDVSNVINMSLPSNLSAYVHRVGRTARAGRKGVAISILDPKDHNQMCLLDDIHQYFTGDEDVEDEVIRELPFSPELVSAFRYRVESVLGSVSARAVKEARLEELRLEMLNSQRLRAHFEDKPRELQLLKHDKVLRPAQVQKHLVHIPSYLMPASLQATPPDVTARVGQKKPPKGKRKRRRGAGSSDPLKAFDASGRRRHRGKSGKRNARS